MRTLLLTTIIVLTSFSSFGKEKPLYGPAIADYGPYFKIENRDVEVVKTQNFKVVFDVKNTDSNKANHNRYIESVARYMNMHAANGVAVENMEIAVVLHGASTKDTLSDKAYKDRHGVDNPNSELIKALNKKGVKFYLCGQSAAFSKIDKNELMPEVSLALSAMTMLVTLQQDGYALLP